MLGSDGKTTSCEPQFEKTYPICHTVKHILFYSPNPNVENQLSYFSWLQTLERSGKHIYIHKYGETILTLMLPLNKSTHAFLHTWCLFHLATRSIVPVIPLKYRTRITLPFQDISLVHKLFGIRIGWTTRYEVGPQVMFLDLVAIYNII
jgi:hypothetical protein